MQKAIQVIVRGKVQGVGFRAATLGKARALGILGYVKNEPNGDVSACFEGSETQLEAMLAWCQLGPIRAKVTDVVTHEVPLKPYSIFSID